MRRYRLRLIIFLHSRNGLACKQGLKWRFQVVGLIHLILLPFMLIFMSIHFFLQNVQHFHSSKAYLGPRYESSRVIMR